MEILSKSSECDQWEGLRLWRRNGLLVTTALRCLAACSRSELLWLIAGRACGLSNFLWLIVCGVFGLSDYLWLVVGGVRGARRLWIALVAVEMG